MMLMLLFTMITGVSVTMAVRCRSSVDLVVKWTIDCSAMNLSVTPIPNNLHPVVLLNVSHNKFEHLTTSQFVNWSDISQLDLSFNSIRDIDAGAFKDLVLLTDLNLSNNYIEILSVNLTNNISRLKILNLSSNRIKIVQPGTFEQVPFLLRLYLRHNTGIGSVDSNYNNLSPVLTQGLISLDISNTTTKDLTDDFFESANSLTSLNVAQNPLSDLPNLPRNLRYLNLSMSFIETVNKDLFQGCEALQKISLEEMPVLREIKPKAFEGLENLEEIIVRNNPKLITVSESVFGDSNPRLSRVIIAHCGLTTLSKELKHIFSRSQWLDFQGNPWICDGRITWMADMTILPNLTQNLRCNKPPTATGMLLKDYYKPRTLHPHTSLIRAGVVIAILAVLVASVVAMVKHSAKVKAKTYRQLEDIRLQERTPQSLPAL